MKAQLPRNLKELVAFIIRHRFGVLVVAIVAYLLWPKRGPHLSTEHVDSDTQAKSKPGAHLTQPQGASAPQLEQMLYDPTGDNPDPKWSMPAELKSEELQNLARRFEQLVQNLAKIGELEQRRSKCLDQLLDQKVKDQ